MKNFEDLGISKELIKGLNELNIIKPTQIQSEVISFLLNEKVDLVGQAQTGTGKTAAYGLPLLHRIDPQKKVIQALILCPTRELGQQIAKHLFMFTKYTDKVYTEAVFGGAKIDLQINALKRPTHIVVATPGRLIDLVSRKAIDLSHVKTLILDEADEMLTMGFKQELDEILGFVKGTDSKWLFSATMPVGIKQIINEHLSPKAHRIEVDVKNIVNENIEHKFIVCDIADKFDVLMQFLKSERSSRGVVFCKTKAGAQNLEKQLIAKNVLAGAIHGDLLQKDRDKVMRAFTKSRLQVLVATDIAARGLDINDLAFVVHYQLPEKDAYYTHRSGRTARAGKKGVSLSLVPPFEMKQIRHFETKLGISFTQIKEKK
ncbi:MAG: DEAD/DEAH box helicase [Salinivirgaceae bacterium]|nr:DEAD/DEAH box helicase [Salinivirgaceae bacterium]